MKNYSIILVSIVLFGLVVSLLVGIALPYYQPATEQTDYDIFQRQNDDTLRILFIGDSWAAYHHGHDSTLAQLVANHIAAPCKVQSVGYVGAKSKEIYERLFADTRPYINIHPDYCIISAGINDAIAKMGPEYYCTNYTQIICFLLRHDIIPVVMDMPDVNYHAVFERERMSAKLRHLLSAFITGTPRYSFQPYREMLRNIISQSEWNDSIVLVKAQRWCNDKGNSKLYRSDGIHLNAQGYHDLDSCMAEEISKHYSNKILYSIKNSNKRAGYFNENDYFCTR